MSNAIIKMPRAEQWADRICTQLGKSVESIIEVGRLLVKAKADLVHGEWGRLFDDQLVPFGQRTAHMLMTVAKHPQISNRNIYSNLPTTWTTLYQLTKVEPTRLSAAFKDGTVTPDMKGRDVKALLPPTKTRTTRRRTPTPKVDPADTVGIGYRTAGSRLYFRIATLLSDEFDTLSQEEQEDVLSMLDQTLVELRQTRKQGVVA